MGDLEAILEYIYKERQGAVPGPGVLATVVMTTGSTYQKVGARCYINTKGQMIGLIGGGCLEQDLRCRSAAILSGTSLPHVVSYDATLGDSSLADLSLGCHGVVTVQLSPITPWLIECLEALWQGVCGEDVILAHRLDSHSHGVLGYRLNMNWVWSESLDSQWKNAIQDQMNSSGEGVASFPGLTCLIERAKRRPVIGLWGAGPDAVALGQLFQWLGWDFCHYDFRSGLLAELPERHRRGKVIDRNQWTNPSAYPDHRAWVLMSHHLHADQACLRAILGKSDIPFYIGLLGPKSRGQALLQGLESASLDRVYSPAGYGMGRGPQEIAVAIAAQIKDVLASYASQVQVKNQCDPLESFCQKGQK